MADSQQARTIIFAGGGSGGHIHPGVAIAEQARLIDSSIGIRFIVKDQALDKAILDAGGWEHSGIDAAPFVKSPKGLIRLARRWGTCFRMARTIIREHHAEGDVRVVAMGGYVAAPVAQAAKAEKAPVTLVNLDAVPGMANRWIAKRATTCMTAAAIPTKFGWAPITPIVRQAAVADADQMECKRRMGVDPLRPMLLITGASQGARSINLLLMAMAEQMPEVFQGWTIVHQVGPSSGDGGEPDVAGAYRLAGIDARVIETIDRMGDAWGACDLAVSRSGAGSVGEIWANAVPALLMPFPYHRDQHQRLNAAPLIDCGGVAMVEDRIDPARNLQEAGAELIGLLCDQDRRDAMRAGLRSLPPAAGARAVAESLVGSG